MSISVLFLHPAATPGGASRSLLEMTRSFPDGSISAHAIVPKGPVAEFLQTASVKVMTTIGLPQFDNTRFGHYRKIRWLILLREIYFFPFFAITLFKAKRRWPGIKVIHANEITLLGAAILARWVFNAPVVMHVRSVQSCSRKTALRSSVINCLIRKYISRVITIDETVKRNLTGVDSIVIHNGFSMVESRGHFSEIRPGNRGNLTVAMVGGLLEMKGIFDFLNAAKICVNKNLNIKFLIVGNNVRSLNLICGAVLGLVGLYRDVRADCHQFINNHHLNGHVKLINFTMDVNAIYRQIDILCFPSHLNAAGRPVFEAAFFEVPSIVAIDNPLPDTFQDRVTGLAVPAKSPPALAEMIEYCYFNRQRVTEMGRNARNFALKIFDSEANAYNVLAVYQAVLSECETSSQHRSTRFVS